MYIKDMKIIMDQNKSDLKRCITTGGKKSVEVDVPKMSHSFE